ncbi:uncharacterized protein LOC107784427 [Nicotiana tabacum]|uniref:Uncharacterized protein LOC107784427 n=1 Tax=Nicotiana tabacum TaxID=4097 RepID=A0A1S3Z9B3_TOBAC|nr:PREDICTED: uncharacterized protein LOC107784427 [Nicotiana tabacum]
MADEDKVGPNHKETKRPLRVPPRTWTQYRRLHRPKTRGGKLTATRAPQRTTQQQRQEHLSKGSRMSRPTKPPSPARTINMIIGGSGDASINGIKFTTTHKLKRSITHERYDGLEESIIIDDSDANGLSISHNDTFVITLQILDIGIKKIMVDDGCGACIIHPRVLAQMKLEDKIVSCCITLTSFKNAVEWTSGEITLPVLANGVTLEMTFHIMDQDTTYNAIVGRPWIHPMRVVPSSLYQVIKLPTPWGIFSIQGEQRTSRECYRIAMDSTTTQQKKDKEKEA